MDICKQKINNALNEVKKLNDKINDYTNHNNK